MRADAYPGVGTPVLEVEVKAVTSPSELREVLRLAKHASRTLGFLPNAAFTDRLRNQGLVVAKLDGTVRGYILYDMLRKGYIKLVHVCVEEAARGNNIAKRMLDYVIALNPHATGIYAACRDDYGIDEFWVKLGLTPKRRIAGRAAKGSFLVQWWRQLGSLDLFESTISMGNIPVAVLDTNVVADLFGSTETFRPTREESSALLASWVADSVKFAVSAAVDIENNRNADREEAQYRYLNSEHLQRLPTTRPDDGQLEELLLERIGADAVTRDPSLRHDVLHLADVIRNEARYFVTHDENLIASASEWAATDYGLRLLRPHQLVAELASAMGRGVFRSRLIESVDLEWFPAASAPLVEVASLFRASERAEPARTLARTIRESISRTPETITTVLSDDSGKPLALLAYERDARSLVVRLLRVSQRRLAATLALQLTRHLREIAVDVDCSTITVPLEAADEATRAALTRDGFQTIGTHLVGFVGPGVITLHDARAWASSVGYTGTTDPISMERALWPLTVTDADLPTYILPIQPRFAESLFGYQTNVLFHLRKRALGLSREHVYFHAAGSGRIPDNPARLLWYVTADGTTKSQAIAAVSRTVEARVLTPDDAHRRFAHMGTLRRNQVREVASKKGYVHVIRFEDSTVLPHPISGYALKVMLEKHHIKTPLQSLRRVPEAFFADVLNASHGVPAT
jgi:hypothetical protein